MNTHANIHLIEQVSAVVRDMLGDDFDAEAFWDSLDGETDAADILDRLIAEERSAAAMVEAIKSEASDLSARASRMEARQKAAKAGILALLKATGETKAERPRATVSIRQGSLSVHITDEASIPSQLCKTVVTPDKAAIGNQLKAGEHVPGAELVRGAESLSLRVK